MIVELNEWERVYVLEKLASSIFVFEDILRKNRITLAGWTEGDEQDRYRRKMIQEQTDYLGPQVERLTALRDKLA